MNPVTIQLSDLQRVANFASLGVPFPKGELLSCDALVVSQDNQTIDAAFKPAAHWPDGSIKWCLVKISLNGSNTSTCDLTLKVSDQTSPKTVLVEKEENTTSITLKTGSLEYTFEKNGNRVFPTVTSNNQPVWNGTDHLAKLQNTFGQECDLAIEKVFVEEHDKLSCVCTVTGKFSDKQGLNLNALFRFEILPNGQLLLKTQLHNPKRAVHPGGIWILVTPAQCTLKIFISRLNNNLAARLN